MNQAGNWARQAKSGESVRKNLQKRIKATAANRGDLQKQLTRVQAQLDTTLSRLSVIESNMPEFEAMVEDRIYELRAIEARI